MNYKTWVTENENDVTYCQNCGKSPTEVPGLKQPKQQNQETGYPLSNLTAKLFSVLFKIVLWIILIGGFIGGDILGKALSGWG